MQLGAPLDREGKARRPDAGTIRRALIAATRAGTMTRCARGRVPAPGRCGPARRHLRVDGKALRGAARGGRVPMLLSGIWDDGITAAQLPVDVKKANEIPIFRDLLKKVPDLVGAVISADEA